jgi:hypothetical protein
MPDVIEFREKTPRSRERERQRQPASAESDIAELASRIASLHGQARGDIDNAVLTLDLAARHARRIEIWARGPSGRKDFDEHIATIERLLQVAREMALKL